MTAAFVSSFSVWAYLKPKYQEAEANKKYKIGYYKFKRNYNIFESLLKGKPQISTAIPGLEQVVFGNPESNLELLFVTNPFCVHCKPVHSIIEEILEKYKDEVSIVIRFNIDVTDATNDVFIIAAHLSRIYFDSGQEKCLTAMHEAFHKLSSTDWIKKWATLDIDSSCYLVSL